jgi:hypothetical protein
MGTMLFTFRVTNQQRFQMLSQTFSFLKWEKQQLLEVDMHERDDDDGDMEQLQQERASDSQCW